LPFCCLLDARKPILCVEFFMLMLYAFAGRSNLKCLMCNGKFDFLLDIPHSQTQHARVAQQLTIRYANIPFKLQSNSGTFMLCASLCCCCCSSKEKLAPLSVCYMLMFMAQALSINAAAASLFSPMKDASYGVINIHESLMHAEKKVL